MRIQTLDKTHRMVDEENHGHAMPNLVGATCVCFGSTSALTTKNVGVVFYFIAGKSLLQAPNTGSCCILCAETLRTSREPRAARRKEFQ